MSEENRENQEQPTIMVPTDDLDKVSEADANTVDQLAMELANRLLKHCLMHLFLKVIQSLHLVVLQELTLQLFAVL